MDNNVVVRDASRSTGRSRWLLPVIGVVVIAVIGAGAAYWSSAATTTSSLWSDSDTPKVASQADGQSVELGVKFSAKYAGQVTGIRFYKGAGNTGTHTGSLWDKDGNRLAYVTFTKETSRGWQVAYFSRPVSIAANVTYVASYHAPNGHFSITNNYFSSAARTNGPLTAPRSTNTSVNGVYNYSRRVKFPTYPSQGDNYWVDVVYTTSTVSPDVKPAPPTSVSATQSGTTVVVKWNAAQSQNPLTAYQIVRNGSQVASVSGSTLQYSDSSLSSNTTYTYIIRAVDNKGAVSDDSPKASITYASPTTPTPPSTPTPPATGRSYPLHTNINATTFWVGEQFQSTSDGSQVCSAYDSQWQYSFFHLKTGTNSAAGCKGAPTGGCDALLKNTGGKCDDNNSIASLRTPANNYTAPAGSPTIYENPFYLDLPYDDYNQSDSTDTTGYATRCKDIPWANDAGYVGHCTDQSFSYMKNRWVKLMANGQTCYGQIEDAGPADDGHGNGNYADANYVFSTTDARPYNKSYNSAGMDVSPTLNACLKGTFNSDLKLNWQFVDAVDVPAGPWKTVITTTPPN